MLRRQNLLDVEQCFESRHIIIARAPPSTRTPRKRFRKFFETSNGRLPLKHSSDRPQTLPKRVSDDPQHFIFRRRKILFGEIFGSKNRFFAILAWFLRSYGQMDLKIRFSVKFCSRYTFPEVCATKNHENDVKTAKIIALNSPP